MPRPKRSSEQGGSRHTGYACQHCRRVVLLTVSPMSAEVSDVLCLDCVTGFHDDKPRCGTCMAWSASARQGAGSCVVSRQQPVTGLFRRRAATDCCDSWGPRRMRQRKDDP
jgi:hypothetical protein